VKIQFNVNVSFLMNSLLRHYRCFEMQFSVNLLYSYKYYAIQTSFNMKFLFKRLLHYCRYFLHQLYLLFDTNILQSDMRDNGQTYHKWAVEADVESLVCDPHNEHSFLVSDLVF
jgi:hypothetical protein